MVTFTGHSKIVGPQFGTCLMTPILCVEFGGDFLKFGRPLISTVYNCYVRGFYLQNLLMCVMFTSDQHGNICHAR